MVARLRMTRELFLLAVGCFPLRAQPALRELWARHDQFVLAGPQRNLSLDRAKVAFSFKGGQGQAVQGWDVGPKDTPVILFFAGGPGGTTRPERLGAGFPVTGAYRHLAIDVPGAGGSQWVPDWKPEDTIEDAETFLKRQGVQGRVYVAGWSWGSTMALLFAQRHPERVRGVVVGGVWTNSPEEVHSYLDADGQRAWMPALAKVFQTFAPGRGTACDLYEAIRSGRGGLALVKAYAEAESDQAGVGSIPRGDLPGPLSVVENPKPVDLKTEQSPLVRFAFIESENDVPGAAGKVAAAVGLSPGLGGRASGPHPGPLRSGLPAGGGATGLSHLAGQPQTPGAAKEM